MREYLIIKAYALILSQETSPQSAFMRAAVLHMSVMRMFGPR